MAVTANRPKAVSASILPSSRKAASVGDLFLYAPGAAVTPIFVYPGEATLSADAGIEMVYGLDGFDIGDLVQRGQG